MIVCVWLQVNQAKDIHEKEFQQAFEMHKRELKQAFEFHEQELKQAEDIHKKEFVQTQRLHFRETEQHLEVRRILMPLSYQTYFWIALLGPRVIIFYILVTSRRT